MVLPHSPVGQPVTAWEAELGRKESSADSARETRGHLVRPHHSNAFQLTSANTRGVAWHSGFDLHRPGCDSAITSSAGKVLNLSFSSSVK